jgi:hypothetical protein
MTALNATAGIMIVPDIKLAIDLFGAGKRGLRQCPVSPRLGPNAKRQRMELGPILREALRNVVCACFSHALILQLVLGGAAGATPASSARTREQSVPLKPRQTQITMRPNRIAARWPALSR